MNRAEILNEARSLTCGARDRDYGDPVENHADIAAGWSVIFRNGVTPAKVAMAMAWVKTCRAITSPEKSDHYVDGAAYFAIAGECSNAVED